MLQWQSQLSLSITPKSLILTGVLLQLHNDRHGQLSELFKPMNRSFHPSDCQKVSQLSRSVCQLVNQSINLSACHSLIKPFSCQIKHVIHASSFIFLLSHLIFFFQLFFFHFYGNPFCQEQIEQKTCGAKEHVDTPNEKALRKYGWMDRQMNIPPYRGAF